MPSINLFNTPESRAKWVCFEGLDLLTNELNISPYFSDRYSEDFAQKFAIGRSAVVPLTQRYTNQRNNMTYLPQSLDRPYTTLTVDQTDTIPFEWESIEAALDMERGLDRIRELYIKPAVAYARQAIESDLAQFAAQNANMIASGGALGTNPTTYDGTSAVSLQMLTEMSCPDNDLGLFVPPAVNRAVKTGALSYFNPTVDLSKQFRTGYVGTTDSFDWYRSMSLYRHTAGTWAGAVTVNGGGQSGSSIAVTCTTGDTFNQGDKISFANVNAVNLMTRQAISTSTAGTKTFSITATTTGVANAATLSIYPPIYGPGSHYQNVDALPIAGAALTLWPGTVNPNGKIGYLALALHKDAFLLASANLEKPKAVEFCEVQTDPRTGISLRIIKQWDSVQSRMITRMDCLWGRGIGLAEQCAVVIPCA